MSEYVNRAAIDAAYQRIRNYVEPTPVMASVFLSQLTNTRVFLKLENLNIAGSFKIRGASSALLAMERKRLSKGVIAASAGNHAQGVARLCRDLQVGASVFMPMGTPLVKAQATRNLGAEVHLVGETWDEAHAAALEHQQKTKGVYVHPFDNPLVVAGQGTVGSELIEQLPNLGAVVVPVGGGGLLAGIACYIKSYNPKIRVIGVQTQAFPYLARRFHGDSPGSVATVGRATIADGIAVKGISDQNVELIKTYVDEMLIVDDDEIAGAIMYLMERDHLLAEGAGAASVAGFLSVAERLSNQVGDGAVACIISGGNIDVNLLSKITTRGLIHSGRLMRVRIHFSDRPGALAQVLDMIGRSNANLLHVTHNRIFGEARYHDVEVDLDLETIDSHQQDMIDQALKAAGYDYKILWSQAHA